MIKVMTIFGTRPEAVKVAPVIKALEKHEGINSLVCVTAQHREMLDQVLEIFDITPDYDLNIMKSGQSLTEITSRVLTGLEDVLKKEQPDMILVHGDTTTTFAAGLAAFYNGVKVGHIEAGLRSRDKFSPYPEEMNRMLTGRLADIHFSPTTSNKQNLMDENTPHEHIITTGNTVIDALRMVIDDNYEFEDAKINRILNSDSKSLLLTSHRRENLGKPMENIFEAVNEVSLRTGAEVIFPIHLNPKVRDIANKCFEGNDRIHIIEPLDYKPFANLMNKVDLILTDSGGIQEEAPYLGKPVLVLRKETERPEAIDAGTVKLAGVDKETIIQMASVLIENDEEYYKMANAVNPYGDGYASAKIVEAIEKYFS